jgi:hypothetical protein
MPNDSCRIIAEETRQIGHRCAPFPGAKMPTRRNYYLLAIFVLYVPDTLAPGLPRAQIASDERPLAPHHGDGGTHHQHRSPSYVRLVLAIFRDHLIVTPDSMVTRDAEIEIIVFRSPDPGFESANLSKYCRSQDHRRGCEDVIGSEKSDVMVPFDDRIVPGVLPRAIPADPHATSGDQGAFRMRREAPESRFDRMR